MMKPKQLLVAVFLFSLLSLSLSQEPDTSTEASGAPLELHNGAPFESLHNPDIETEENPSAEETTQPAETTEGPTEALEETANQTPDAETETEAPADETPAAETEAPTGETETPALETETSAPETETPAPETETPAPETETPAPETETPAPETETPAPETETPAPETEAPAPETQAPTTLAPISILPTRYVKIPYKKGTETRYTLIGTLDNVLPDNNEVGSQRQPLFIPSGWKLATKNVAFEQVMVEQNLKFGTECLVYVDGSGISTASSDHDCGPGSLLKTDYNGKAAYQLPDFKVPRRILIMRDASFKTPEAPCGICEAWGDPHVQVFDKSVPEMISPHQGTYIYYTNKPEVQPSFEVSYTQFKVGYASAISEVFVRYDTDVLVIKAEESGAGIYRGGVPVNFDQDFRGQILIQRPKPNQFKLIMPNNVQLSVSLLYFTEIPYLASIIAAPNSLTGKTTGICGSCGESYPPVPPEEIFPPWEKMDLSRRQVIESNTESTGQPRQACANEQLRAFAEWACRGSTRKSMESCIFDVCMTGSPELAQSYYEITGQSRLDALSSVSDCKQVEITNTAKFQGFEFAVLDNIPANETFPGIQKDYITLPEGWELARNTPITRAFIACSNFGTTCITLRDGTSLTKDLQICNQDNLVIMPDKCFRPKSGSRILIYRQPEVGFIRKSELLFTLDGAGGVKGWSAVGRGYTTSSDTMVKIANKTAIRVTTDNNGESGAKFRGAYKSSSPFTVGVWSKSNKEIVRPNTEYGFKVELEYSSGAKVVAAKGLFNPTNTDFNFRSVDITPTEVVDYVTLTLYVSNFPGADVIYSSLWISSEMTHNSGNMLVDPSVQNGNGWKAWKNGFSVDNADRTVVDKSGSIKITSPVPATSESNYAAFQTLTLTASQKKNLRGVYFSGWSRASRLIGKPSSGYSLFVNVKFEDNTNVSGLIAQFDKFREDWQFSEKIFRIAPNKVVSSIEFLAMLRGHSGTVYFDDLYLTLLNCDEYSSKSVDTLASVVGFAHVVSFRGKIFDLSLGDYLLYEDSVFKIIGRVSKEGDSAVLSSVRITHNQETLEIAGRRRMEEPLVSFNSQPADLLVNVERAFDNFTVVKSGSLRDPPAGIRTYFFFVEYATSDHRFVVAVHSGDSGAQWLQFFPRPPTKHIDEVKGVMGRHSEAAAETVNILNKGTSQLSEEEMRVWRVKNSTERMERKSTDRYPLAFQQRAMEVCFGTTLNDICVNDYLASSADSGVEFTYSVLEQTLSSSENPLPNGYNDLSVVVVTPEENGYRKGLIVAGVICSLLILGLIVAVVVMKTKRTKRVGSSLPIYVYDS